MFSDTLLVMPAGGYSTRLGIPKHTVKLFNGEYLFENTLRGFKLDTCIVTNRKDMNWWNQWLEERGRDLYRKQKTRINIIPEEHTNSRDAVGPLKCLNDIILPTFPHYNNIVVVACDVFFSNFYFVPKLLSKKNAIVYSKYPKEHLEHMGTLALRGVFKRRIDYFVEKGSSANDNVFTSVFKTEMKNVPLFKDMRGNLGDVIYTLLNAHRKIDIDVIQFKGLYRDIGIPQTYNELIEKGYLTREVKV